MSIDQIGGFILRSSSGDDWEWARYPIHVGGTDRRSDRGCGLNSSRPTLILSDCSYLEPAVIADVPSALSYLRTKIDEEIV